MYVCTVKAITVTILITISKLKFLENKHLTLKKRDGIIFLTVLFFALFLRTYQLDIRPLHVDEAVHAIKFGQLLEEGVYRYDPVEYHGPTLNYLTLIPAYLTGKTQIGEVSEYTLRLIPSLISILLFASLFIVIPEKGYSYVMISILLLTISPVFLFYSRYYIQEALFVSFTFMAFLTFYKYYLKRKIIWLIFAGILSGLVFATKETSIITFASTLTSLFILLIVNKSFRKKLIFPLNHIILFLISGIITAILFYSSFFSHMQGIADSILTFGNYFNKVGTNIQHIHPWYYYLELLLFSNSDYLLYTEIPIFILGMTGVFFSFYKVPTEKRLFFQLLSLFSILQLMIYSYLPYKTPWLLLNFWLGFILLAAYGIIQLYKKMTNIKLKKLYIVIIMLIFIHNGWQSYLTSFKYPWQAENPFTYSQATPDVLKAAQNVLAVADANPEGMETFIYAVFPEHDYWPLPWYTRKQL